MTGLYWPLVHTPPAAPCSAPLVEWSKEDNHLACMEGWAFFDADEGIQLQRVDEAQEGHVQLASDLEAWALVRAGAAASNPLHVRALAYLYSVNPAEHANLLVTTS